jgi:hypothetical protein
MKIAILMALTATVAMSSAAESQKPTTRRGAAAQSRKTPNARTQGFMLGVHTIAAKGVTLLSEEFAPGYGTNLGVGAGLTLGYGFNRRISSYVSFDVAKQTSNLAVEGTYGLSHLELGVRANFPDVALGWRNTIPYLSGSIGRRALGARVYDVDSEEEGEIAFHGNMVGLGIGLEHFFSPKMSFDAGLQLGLGTFDQFTVDNESMDYGGTGVTTVRMRVGLTWRP